MDQIIFIVVCLGEEAAGTERYAVAGMDSVAPLDSGPEDISEGVITYKLPPGRYITHGDAIEAARKAMNTPQDVDHSG
jgi:hypothetical protein